MDRVHASYISLIRSQSDFENSNVLFMKLVLLQLKFNKIAFARKQMPFSLPQVSPIFRSHFAATPWRLLYVMQLSEQILANVPKASMAAIISFLDRSTKALLWNALLSLETEFPFKNALSCYVCLTVKN